MYWTTEGTWFGDGTDARLWTIEDAKDDDILVDEDNNIGIYRGKVDDVDWQSYIYLGCDNYLRGSGYHIIKNTKPATKEQRDQLAKAIADAGFTFDSKKKELKKIEQNPACSEEDEKRAESLLGWLDTLVNYIHHDTIVSLDLRRERMQQVEQLKTWLKSLKDRVQPQPKQEWSEEDEKLREQVGYAINQLHVCECTKAKLLDWLTKQGEQKVANNVGSRFKVGDWVVFNNKHQSIYQVEKIEDGYYILRHTHGGTFRISVLHDESLRLWTIEDAKDGDVLFEDKISSLPSPFIVIFKKKDSVNTFSSHCFIGFDGKFYEGEDEHYSENLHPATKEQRDQLAKAISDAGYTFDFDKKELKKIEDKPEWSEEDEAHFDSISKRCTPGITYTSTRFSISEDINWLKSIKDRIGNFDHGYKVGFSVAKHNQWEPSDVQMRILSIYADQNNTHGSVLTSLYHDLKKLREE